ncbi:MAG: hypothetical protein B7X50_04965 [Alishewanella sp. 34-51-39]|nr:MAG: hypothetical protein B7Z18_08345 [Alishewanella sp. 32-51-5]OZB42198.1 MAG: hypothetical protein B7X50_04965 [Alishewanella sp. 34-51-39]
MKRVFGILILLTALFAAPVMANQCLNYLNFNQGLCGSYRYHPINVYFRDQNGVQQELTVHRIYNSSGVPVQADLDFKVNCLGGCGSNIESTVNTVLWAFRDAYLNNRFYTIRYCDPLYEVCCDGSQCMEILSEPQSKFNSNDSFQVEELSGRRGTRRPIEENIPIADSALNLYDRAVRTSNNEAELRQQVVAQQQASMKFMMTVSTSGGHNVCVITGDVCAALDGYVSVSDSFSSVQLEHNYGPKFNTELDRWLRDWFSNQTQQKTCTQSMSCDVTGRCTITMRCSIR